MKGETIIAIIDLGSDAGFDVFLTAKQVGSRGRAIGLDMIQVSTEIPTLDSIDQHLSQDMLACAKENHAKSAAADHVEFPSMRRSHLSTSMLTLPTASYWDV